MSMPARLILQDCFYLLDGGTIILNMVDESGQCRQAILTQHAFPETSSMNNIPGRLYFDCQLVPIRSRLESELLELLRNADIQMAPVQEQEGSFRSQGRTIIGEDIRHYMTRGPEDNIHWARTELIGFVASDQYEKFAWQVEQAADPIRYDVWIAWDNINRKTGTCPLGQNARHWLAQRQRDSRCWSLHSPMHSSSRCVRFNRAIRS